MEGEKVTEIAAALRAKGVTNPCSRCGKRNFEIVGEGLIALQSDPNVMTLGGPAIPIVIIACSNCGHVTQHAKGPLGIMKGVGDAK